MNKKVCAIIDPYSSSNLYAPAFIDRGLECIAVLSQAAPTQLIANSFRADDFAEVLKFTGKLDDLAWELKKRNVELIVPGMEMGIELADALGSKIRSPLCNDPQTSHLRRHKFDMVEAVRAYGLKAVQQIKSSEIEQALAWAKNQGSWPLVVKPADSGGADRVFLCRDEHELRAAFHSSLGTYGRQGRVIQELVVQQFMRGTEYIVDTVSHQGHHMVVNIWKYNRIFVNGAPFVYDTKELVPWEGEVQQQLMAYTKKALDAVGLKNGPAHNEIMLTTDGPMLVEINARLGGSMAPILNRHCVGRGQLDVMMDVIFDLEKFFSYCDKPYEIQKHGLAVYFISKHDEHVVSGEAMEQIRGLLSCHSLRMGPPGSKLAKTVDMFTMPGMVELVHADSKQIHHDYEWIRELEASGNFYLPVGL